METFKMLQAMNVAAASASTTHTSGDQLIESFTLKDSILNESQELDSILTRLRERLIVYYIIKCFSKRY